MSFRKLVQVDPETLVEARMQAHYATQPVGAVGFSLCPPRDDDSHMSLTVHPERNMVLGEPIPAAGGARAGIRLGVLEAVVVDGEEPDVSTTIEGLNLDELIAWYAARLGERCDEPVTVTLPSYEMPDHPLAHGSRFEMAHLKAEFQEIDAWYMNLQQLLAETCASVEGCEPLRLWPHHFDLATLEVVEAGATRDDMKSVGRGVSPGDATVPEPYVYVNVWPIPEPDLFSGRALPIGHWHTEGWSGAVLCAAELKGMDGTAQQHAIREFLATASSVFVALHNRD